MDHPDGYSSDSSESSLEPRAKRRNPARAIAGAATYLISFQQGWSADWPFITKGSTSHHFWCSICRVERSCGHQGKKDIERHVLSESHTKKTKDVRSSGRITTFFNQTSSVGSMTQLEMKVSYE